MVLAVHARTLSCSVAPLPPTVEIALEPTVLVISISLPLCCRDHKVALRTCSAPLDRTVCLTGLWATDVTSLEVRDTFGVLKLIVVVQLRFRLCQVCLRCFTGDVGLARLAASPSPS